MFPREKLSDPDLKDRWALDVGDEEKRNRQQEDREVDQAATLSPSGTEDGVLVNHQGWDILPSKKNTIDFTYISLDLWAKTAALTHPPATLFLPRCQSCFLLHCSSTGLHVSSSEMPSVTSPISFQNPCHLVLITAPWIRRIRKHSTYCYQKLFIYLHGYCLTLPIK